MKRLIIGRRGTQGFTIVETVLAISLLSFAAIMGSRTLLSTTRGVHTLRFQKKASVLAEMVLQQYDAYTASNYQILSSFNATNQSPKDFFNRPDNFGYDGMVITTQATYSQNRSSCTVNVGLAWHDGGRTVTTTYVKTYAQNAQLGSGAALQVWLKLPCPQGTTPDTIIANCPGLSGFTLSAASVSPGNTVTGTTDANGQALLKQVIIGGSVVVQVNAPTLADFTISTAAPGYFAQDSGGNYVVTLNKTASLSAGNLNTLLVTDFRPTGQVTGQVINDDTLMANPPVTGLQVSLGGAAMVASGGTFQSCGNSGEDDNNGINCSVTTDPTGTGQYIFNNVIPSSLTVSPIGRAGSAPAIQQSDPSFMVGYTNAQSISVKYADWSGALTKNTMNQGPILPEIVHVQRMGWIVLQTVNQQTSPSVPVPNMTIAIRYPSTPFSQGSGGMTTVPFLTDANGLMTLNNVIASNSSQFTSNATRAAQSGDNGYYGSLSWQCSGTCMGVASNIPYPVSPLYQLSGKLVDDNSVNGMSGMTMTGTTISGNVQVSVNAGGIFSVSSYRPPITGDVTIPFQTALAIQNTSLHVTNTLLGSTLDQANGGPAPSTTLSIVTGTSANGNTTVANYKSDSNGYFNITSTFPYVASIPVTMVCSNSSMKCAVCPANSACNATNGSDVHINTSMNTVTFQSNSNAHGFTYNGPISVSAQQGVPIPSMTINCKLQDYAVQGSVRTASGSALGGITVNDLNGNKVGKSATGTNGSTLGAYSGWANVQGHNASSAGSITLTTNSQSVSGQSYAASTTGAIALPTGGDPTVALTQNVSVSPVSGSSGGTSGSGI